MTGEYRDGSIMVGEGTDRECGHGSRRTGAPPKAEAAQIQRRIDGKVRQTPGGLKDGVQN